ncbi:MAG: DNA internalization-related competence protein ComEC/Rec2 [Oscillospiraceae bacterium]|nr:DNA internalization-related competence protein ComEC/Rec2 [Oscillospiraceae bacterium]
MRKLAWAALGFTAAVILAEYDILPASGLPYIAAALAVLSLGALALHGLPRKRMLLLVLSASIGLLWWWGHYTLHIQPCETLARQRAEVTAVVTDYPQTGDGYTRLEVRITGGAPQEKAVLYLYTGELPELAPGDIIQTEIKITSALVRGGERTRTYTARNQNLLGYIQGEVTVTGRSGQAWRYFPKVLCQRVKTLCGEIFPADTAPFMTALLTGDTTALENDGGHYAAMRLSGVLHVVAVSGMHLFVLTAFCQLVLGRSLWANLLCIAAVVLFTLLAGCRPSIVRAAVMQSMLLLAPVLGRENDPPTSLAAALMVMLLVNPSAIAGVGLQLSFSCVAGLLLLLPRLLEWCCDHLPMEKSLVRAAASSLACTVGATAFSLPLSAWYFGTVPLFSPIANLLTLGVVEICFGAGYVLCVLGAVLPGFAALLGWVMSWLVRWCMLVYDTIAAIPFACLYTTDNRAALWLLGVYGLMILWYILRRRGVYIRLGIPASLCVIGLCAVLLTGDVSLRRMGGILTVLDVGQGESVALTDEKAAALIDCGGSGQNNAGDVAADYLLSLGQSRVDVLILTHLHEDHTNGVEELLYRMAVSYLIYPADAEDGDDTLEDILALAERQGTQTVALSAACTAQVGNMTLTMYLPQAGSDENERGIVVLAEVGGGSALIMGDAGEDAELALLEQGAVPDVDVLVVGHHGSKTASSPLFLRAAQAETAVISVGYNSYNLPAEEILERLAAYCPVVLRTDQAGNVAVTLTEEENNG